MAAPDPRMTPMMIGYFCQGWTGWLYVTWMPSLFSKNYGLDPKKSPLFFAGTLFCAMIAELLGGVVTDYLLRRTQSLLGAVMTYWFRPDRPLDTVPSVGRLAVAGE